MIVSMEHVSIKTAAGRTLVSDVSVQIAKGECLGIVGESGSGKTLLCRALLGLLPEALRAEGKMYFEGNEMLTLSNKKKRQILGTGIAAILQHSMTAFDPLYTIGSQFVETLMEKLALTKHNAFALAAASLKDVQLGENVLKKYPHQLSGGMLQRCMIALTLALNARVVVADEPTTALDAKNQYDVLQLFRKLRTKSQSALIFVSHDLGAVQMLADSLIVMCQGRCVEAGDAQTVFSKPKHAYTQYLIATRLALTRGFTRALGEVYGSTIS